MTAKTIYSKLSGLRGQSKSAEPMRTQVSPLAVLAEAEEVVLYHWNRTYPSDRRFPLPLAGWTLARREEFSGSSHEKITKEVYRR